MVGGGAGDDDVSSQVRSATNGLCLYGRKLEDTLANFARLLESHVRARRPLVPRVYGLVLRTRVCWWSPASLQRFHPLQSATISNLQAELNNRCFASDLEDFRAVVDQRFKRLEHHITTIESSLAVRTPGASPLDTSAVYVAAVSPRRRCRV